MCHVIKSSKTSGGILLARSTKYDTNTDAIKYAVMFCVSVKNLQEESIDKLWKYTTDQKLLINICIHQDKVSDKLFLNSKSAQY